MILDPIVHAALVVVFTWLLNLFFVWAHIDLGGDIVTQLATLLVGYILSLFGYSLYARIFANLRGVNVANDRYKPPFT